jgi:hypothetical protein
MFEVVSGISILGRIFVNARIRAGSSFKWFLCLGLIDVRCFRLPLGVRIPQVEGVWSKAFVNVKLLQLSR